MYTPPILLLSLLLSLLSGLTLADRPLNVPNFLLVTSPVLELGLPVDGDLISMMGKTSRTAPT
jgi:hypothetical protein